MLFTFGVSFEEYFIQQMFFFSRKLWSEKQINLACSESNPTFVGKIIFYYAQNRA